MFLHGYLTFCRLSLAKMQSVQNGMSGRDVQWKATCNYAFADGQATSDDVVRSSFETLNLFSFVTNGKIFLLFLEVSIKINHS